MIVKLSNFEIKIVDFFEDKLEMGSMYITDSEIRESDFDSFLDFYGKYNQEGNYFNASVFNKDFDGRFGQLIYSKEGNKYLLRLVFVESDLDNDESLRGGYTSRAITDGVQFRNLVDLVAKQEIVLERLESALVDRGLFTKSEIDNIYEIDETEIKEMKFTMRSEIKNIKEYLLDMEDTIQERKENINS